MPTTSQNKVMAHVTGKSTRKRGKVVLKQYKMEPSHQFDTLTSSVEDNCPESTDDQVTTVVQADQSESTESTDSSQARESERLHQLGFWNSVDKKDIKVKKIGVAAQEKPTGESEEIKQYNEVISQEVERKVDEKLDCPSVKRRAPPELVTSAVCFELKGSVATHVEVLSKMKEMLCYRKGSKIITIQFVPKSRWIIVLDSQETRDRLAGMEFFIGRHSVLLRRYDDVMKMEYRKYLRGQGLLEMVHSATK